MGDLCRANDSLLLVDTVTSMGGIPLYIDDWKIDAAYAGSQKCLSCPPGISPLTFGERAMKKIKERKGKVKNWYLDLSLLGSYWGKERTYHHTAPINMNYGLYEALRLVLEEGLENRWERHQSNADLLVDGLRKIGLEPYAKDEIRLSSLITVGVPEGVNAKDVTSKLLNEYNIEIGNGLGELAGKVCHFLKAFLLRAGDHKGFVPMSFASTQVNFSFPAGIKMALRVLISWINVLVRFCLKYEGRRKAYESPLSRINFSIL